ncbi:MAG: hypothetical protein HYX32_13965 [Actinobacteria bacterium]|nr:hypothetical protein [Actinomycetota bacterium]
MEQAAKRQPALAKTLVDQVSTDLTLTDQQRNCAQDQLSGTTPDLLIAALNGDNDAINTIETTIKTTCNIS